MPTEILQRPPAQDLGDILREKVRRIYDRGSNLSEFFKQLPDPSKEVEERDIQIPKERLLALRP